MDAGIGNLPTVDDVAQQERERVTDFVEKTLPDTTRVSVYLFQPIRIDPGVLPDSPGVLWDVGPLPKKAKGTPRSLLFTDAQAGRTGSFLQSAEQCLSRTQETTAIDDGADKSFRSRNTDAAARKAQIAVEAERHGFSVKRPDGPPVGWYIHHLALAPGVQSFEALSDRRIPVLGTIFTMSEPNTPTPRHLEYTNLVDFAMYIAEHVLEIRTAHLLGADVVADGLQQLCSDPAGDAAVQLAVKLLFAHHWFFPYHPAAFLLLRSILGGDDAAEALYTSHGWIPPLKVSSPEGNAREWRRVVIADIVTLVQDLRSERQDADEIRRNVTRVVNTALLLLCGHAMNLTGTLAWNSARGRPTSVLLAPRPASRSALAGESLFALMFRSPAIRNVIRRTDWAERFVISRTVCGPGQRSFQMRSHLMPSGLIESFDVAARPQLADLRRIEREKTKWFCCYTISRLAEAAQVELRAPISRGTRAHAP